MAARLLFPAMLFNCCAVELVLALAFLDVMLSELEEMLGGVGCRSMLLLPPELELVLESIM